MRIVIIHTNKTPTVGQQSYSPGLNHDTQMYINGLKSLGYTPDVIPSYGKLELLKQEPLPDIVIGIEELGSEEYWDWYLQNHNVKLALVFNFEIINPWVKTTYQNIHRVNYLISKAPDPPTWIRDLNKRIICVPHTSPLPTITTANNISRTAILHFAGTSPYKNTIENIKAGIKILEAHPRDFTKFYVFIARWPKKREWNFRGTLPQHPKLEYVGDGTYIDQKTVEHLYAQTRLALCASNCEGFGHYINDAILRDVPYIITTDCWPMNQFAAWGGVTLAKPSKIEPFGFCSRWCSVPCDRIVDAFNDIYAIDVETRMPHVGEEQTQAFHHGLKSLIEPQPIAYTFTIFAGNYYIPGVLVAAWSLRKIAGIANDIDIVCCITPDVTDTDALYRVCDRLWVQQPISINTINKMRTQKQTDMYGSWMNIAPTKWICLSLTNYKKIIFLDADKIILQPLHQLVVDAQIPPGTIAGMFSNPWIKMPSGWYPDQDWQPVDRFRIAGALTRYQNSIVLGGSVLILEPSHQAMKNIRDFCERQREYGHQNCNSAIDEQVICEALNPPGGWIQLTSRWSAIPWKREWLAGQMPLCLHYFNIKPWELDRHEWIDLEMWNNIAWNLLQQYPELRRCFKTKNTDATPITNKCSWCGGTHQAIDRNLTIAPCLMKH